jgi:hypothetical protein
LYGDDADHLQDLDHQDVYGVCLEDASKRRSKGGRRVEERILMNIKNTQEWNERRSAGLRKSHRHTNTTMSGRHMSALLAVLFKSGRLLNWIACKINALF